MNLNYSSPTSHACLEYSIKQQKTKIATFCLLASELIKAFIDTLANFGFLSIFKSNAEPIPILVSKLQPTVLTKALTRVSGNSCMATTSTSAVSYALSWTIVKCSSAGEYDPRSHKLNKSSVKVNGTHSTALPHAATKLETFSATSAVAFVEGVAGERSRQNIPTEKQNADPFRQGLIVEGGVGYRQTVVIRSYEVGPDKTATLETILNLLQVTYILFLLLYMYPILLSPL